MAKASGPNLVHERIEESTVVRLADIRDEHPSGSTATLSREFSATITAISFAVTTVTRARRQAAPSGLLNARPRLAFGCSRDREDNIALLSKRGHLAISETFDERAQIAIGNALGRPSVDARSSALVVP